MFVKIWEILFVWAACALLLFYLHVIMTAPRPEESFIPSEKMLKSVDNGDLVFFSGDTQGERLCRWCTSSPFSHVGIVLREKHPITKEDIPYLFECDLGQGSKDGVRLIKLSDKLDRYKGFRVGAYRKLQKQRPHLDKMLELVGRYSHLDFDNLMIKWWVGRTCSSIVNPQTVFCSELVAKVLKDLGILQQNAVEYTYSPKDFYEGIGLEEGSYGPPQNFSFPPKN